MSKPTDLAKKVVAAIEDDLRDRRGLRQAFEEIDRETQREIRKTWAGLVDKLLEAVPPAPNGKA